jgi:DNA-binding transcriptional LysR family regulator
MDLNIRQLRYFLAIAAAGTFTQAAGELFITSPSLSEQIAKLERQLGFRLFDRGPKGTSLTPAGEVFLKSSQELIEVHDRTVNQAKMMKSDLTSAPAVAFRLGFQAGMIGPSTSDILAEFRALEPTCELILSQLSWADQVAGVAAGILDAALVRPPLPPSTLNIVPLFTEPRSLVASVRHPLAGRKHLAVADLTGVVQVKAAGVPPAWGAWWAIDPRPDGTPVRYGHVVRSVEEMLQVVAATDCVSITPASFAQLFPRSDIVFIPISDAEPSTIELVLPTGPISKIAASLLSSVKNVVSQGQSS